MTVEPARDSWVDVPADSDFTLQNLPYGIFSDERSAPRAGVAIGAQVVDLHALARRGLLDDVAPDPVGLLSSPTLNPFLAAGRGVWRGVRERLVELLAEDGDPTVRDHPDGALLPVTDATLHVPVAVGDFVDFYSSLEHARNLGRMFRPDGDPLLPNWRHLPVGYHGRSSTIVVSGTGVHRPRGQRLVDGDVVFGPTQALDFELEVGFLTGGPANALGHPVAAGDAREHIFGMVLVNDWSARDVQAWEYQPLGPFLGKSFATSISPWVVPLAALEPYLVPGPEQVPPPLAYLAVEEPWNVDLHLQVALETPAMRDGGQAPAVVARTNARLLYWNMAQQLAHATANGAVARPGDLFASGTISGAADDSRGSMIELTWRGQHPLRLPDGSRRGFLEDGDRVLLTGWCGGDGRPRVGFGDLWNVVQPAP
jgi:fumarylacetoacetase